MGRAVRRAWWWGAAGVLVAGLVALVASCSLVRTENERFAAEAAQTLVPGADRATVERFFDRHGVRYSYDADTFFGSRFGDRNIDHRGALYQARWTPPRGLPPGRELSRKYIVVLIDAQGGVIAYLMLPDIRSF
jgi:hypothetical protein